MPQTTRLQDHAVEPAGPPVQQGRNPAVPAADVPLPLRHPLRVPLPGQAGPDSLHGAVSGGDSAPGRHRGGLQWQGGRLEAGCLLLGLGGPAEGVRGGRGRGSLRGGEHPQPRRDGPRRAGLQSEGAPDGPGPLEGGLHRGLVRLLLHLPLPPRQAPLFRQPLTNGC